MSVTLFEQVAIYASLGYVSTPYCGPDQMSDISEMHDTHNIFAPL